MKPDFTPEQIKTINDNWEDGKHPEKCTGNCSIYGIEIAQCSGCGWDDGYIPVSTEPYNN